MKLNVPSEILLSTVYQAVRYYREVGAGNRLLAILVQHNTFYFCCSLGEHGRPACTVRISERVLIDIFSVLCDSDCDYIFYHGACVLVVGAPSYDASCAPGSVSEPWCSSAHRQSYMEYWLLGCTVRCGIRTERRKIRQVRMMSRSPPCILDV